MKNSLFISIFLGLGLLFTACENDPELDTQRPEIKTVTINSQDHNIGVTAGAEMHVEALLTDNEELGELKIDIHDIFDGHGHKSSLRWAEVLTIPLSGKEQHIHEHLAVPADATAGPYHAVFRLIDSEGNESEFVEVDFIISNGSEPQIAITDPDFTGEVHAPKNSTLTIQGSVTDDKDLEEIRVSLSEEHGEHKFSADAVLYDQDFDLEGQSDVSWDFQTDGNVNINIPADAETGHYILKLVVLDNEGNMNIFEAEVHVM